ncbi:DUF1563 domain-containing protein [Acholeplasma laidlawii]
MNILICGFFLSNTKELYATYMTFSKNIKRIKIKPNYDIKCKLIGVINVVDSCKKIIGG